MRALTPRFDQSGSALVTHRDGELRVFDASGVPLWQRAVPGLLDFTPMGTEVWAVDARQLRRFALRDGTPLGQHVLPALDPTGWLLVSSAAPELAIWQGAQSRILRPDADPVVQDLPCEGALVMPIAEHRWLAWSAGQLRLWRPIGDAWRTRVGDPGSRVLDGQLVLDGRLFAIAQRRDGASEVRITVVSTRDGSLHTTVRLPHVVELRFAARRGYAVALSASERAGRVAQRLIIVDLRFGRLVRELELPEGVDEVAVDDGVRTIGLVEGGAVRVVTPEALALAAEAEAEASEHAGANGNGAAGNGAAGNGAAEAAASAATADGPGTRIAVEGAASQPAADVVDEVPEEAAEPEPALDDEPLPTDPLILLDPVQIAPLATTAEVIQALDVRMQWIGARVAAAIADAWDSGRIVHSNPLGLPYAEEVAGILRLASGLAPDQLAETVARAQAAEAMLGIADRGRHGRLTPLDVLARDFELSPLAVQILLVVCGPQLRGDYARLYGILANDPGRPLVDEQLVGQILAVGAPAQLAAIGRELDADRPLRRYGLINVGNGSRPFCALTVEPLVARTVANQPIEGEPDQYLRIRHADRALEELQMPSAVVRGALRYLSRSRDEATRIVVRGRTGTGRHTFLAALAARAGRALGVIDTTTVPREPGRLPRILEVLLRRAMLRGLVPVVDGLELVSAEDPDTKVQISAVLREHPGPVALRLPSEAQIPLDPGYLLVDVPQRNERQRTDSWMIAMNRHGIPLADGSELAARYRVGPGVIERVCAEVMRRPDPPPTPQAWVAALDEAVRQHLENRLGTTANRVTRLASWADVVLPEDILDSLLELTARVRHRKKVFETWGFDKSMSTSRGITALFSGSPGTGKTMVAGVIARDLGLEVYRVDVARITSKWIGETEKNLGSLFDAAEDGQVMLLFDEADSLFAKRTEVKSSVDRYANMEVNYLLQRLDSFEGIAILTTNFGTSIDPAFKRRLSFRVTFPFPDEDMREKLWKALIPPEAPIAGAMDFARLSQKFKLSGGYIRNAALRAAFLAAEEGSAMTQEHIERAIRMEFREIGKLADSGVLE
jgi:hypothetical protein